MILRLIKIILRLIKTILKHTKIILKHTKTILKQTKSYPLLFRLSRILELTCCEQLEIERESLSKNRSADY